MARILRLISRWAATVPPLASLARRLFPDPFRFVSGKPLERWLLIFDLGERSLALANDPQTVETVMLDRDGTFPKSAALTALLGPLIGKGVFGQPGGPAVKANRRLHLRALARLRDQDIADLSRQLTATYIAQWLQESPETTVPICTELSRLTVDIVSQGTLDRRFDAGESRRFASLFFTYHRQCVPLLMLMCPEDPATRAALVRHMGLTAIGSDMRHLIRARFLTPMLAGDGLASSFGMSLTEAGLLASPPSAATTGDEALDEIAVLLLAGHETTASTLSWLIWELARCPWMQDAAAALLTEASADGQGPARLASLPESWKGIDADRLLKGLSREALRLYPPIAFFLREAEREVCARGKTIPGGSYHVISPWTLHRHRRKWEQPDEFRPERWWLQQKEPARTSYLPFGMGPRTCPGARFAEIEMREILRVLLSHCRFSIRSPQDPKPLGSLTSRPDREIHLAVEARPNEQSG